MPHERFVASRRPAGFAHSFFILPMNILPYTPIDGFQL
jgi:hypothetical protein